MDEGQKKMFLERLELDFAFEIKELSRVRVNLFKQHRGIAAVFRVIPNNIPTISELALPEVITELCSLKNGLVLVIGPTGSGKSSTLASMIDHINHSRNDHIITIEDPIEFIHTGNTCLINQRELHSNTLDLNGSLKIALRSDPDVIMIGELRDLETMRLAITAAETGHLVFGTLHTSSAAKTINRIIDMFPGNQQSMIRSMVSNSLKAVISQTLVPKPQSGRVAALEIMKCNHAISNLIREDKIAQIYSVIQTSKSEGMQTMEQHLEELKSQGLIG